jgi:RNA polymerase sigma-70 factor (ECF subfamily)
MKDEDRTQQLLGRFHEYLTFLARLQTAGRSKAKLDVSGIVQQTLLEAHQAIAELASLNEERQTAWLRQALTNNLADEIRKLSAQKRDIRMERSLDAGLDGSMQRLGQLLPADSSSPSRRAHKNEQLLALAQALNRLPETQRQAVELHHLLGLSLSEVAERLQSTKPAVAGLLHRGLKKLRELLADTEAESA